MLSIFKPTKAKIKILATSDYGTELDKLSLDGESVLEVQINPNKVTITDGVKYETTNSASKQSPRTMASAQYQYHNNRTLKFDLIFDTYTTIFPEKFKKDVKTEHIDKFLKLVENGSTDIEPPRVFFSWGSIQMLGYITELTYSYTMFTSNGIPVRATMTLTITEYDFGD